MNQLIKQDKRVATMCNLGTNHIFFFFGTEGFPRVGASSTKTGKVSGELVSWSLRHKVSLDTKRSCLYM